MKKRTFAALLAALVLAATAGGCVTSGSQNQAAPQSPASETGTEAPAAEGTSQSGDGGGSVSGEIVFMKSLAMEEDSIFVQKTNQFNEDNGVNVVIETVNGNDLLDKFTTAALAGAGPDVITLDSGGWPINCAAMGVLKPLTSRLTPVMNEYLPGPIESGHYRDDYYVLPWYYNNTGLYYNKALLEEVGVDAPPTTWEELESAVQALTEAGYKGLMTRLDGYAIYNFLFQGGNSVIDTSGETPVVTINDDSGKKAWEYYTGFHTQYNAFPEGLKDANDWDSSYTPFLNGECGFFICGDWAYNNLVNGNPDLDFGIVSMPKGEVEATVLGGYVLAMGANTQNEDLAWEYMRFITAKDQDDTLLELGRAPGRPDADTDALLSRNPYYDVFIQQAGVTKARPLVINSADLDNMIVDAFKYVLFDQKTPQEALDDLEQQLNDFVEENY